MTFLTSAMLLPYTVMGEAPQSNSKIFLSGAGNLESFSYYFIPACLCRYQFLCCAQALHGRNSFGLETIHVELHRCTCIGGCYSPPPSPKYAGHADDGTMVQQGVPTSCYLAGESLQQQTQYIRDQPSIVRSEVTIHCALLA